MKDNDKQIKKNWIVMNASCILQVKLFQKFTFSNSAEKNELIYDILIKSKARYFKPLLYAICYNFEVCGLEFIKNEKIQNFWKL